LEFAPYLGICVSKHILFDTKTSFGRNILGWQIYIAKLTPYDMMCSFLKALQKFMAVMFDVLLDNQIIVNTTQNISNDTP
jgi:hypothetical protein